MVASASKTSAARRTRPPTPEARPAPPSGRPAWAGAAGGSGARPAAGGRRAHSAQRRSFHPDTKTQPTSIRGAQPSGCRPDTRQRRAGPSSQPLRLKSTASQHHTCHTRHNSPSSTTSQAAPKSNAHLVATLALVLGSCHLSVWAGPGVQCAPAPHSLANGLHLSPSGLSELAAADQQPLSATQDLRGPAPTDAADPADRLAELRRRLEIALLRRQLEREQQDQRDSEHILATPAADQSHDDEIVVLVLADSLLPSTAQSIRRLFKRSGISDQRLAEIQMLRALKKQSEKTKMASSTSGSQDGTSQAAS